MGVGGTWSGSFLSSAILGGLVSTPGQANTIAIPSVDSSLCAALMPSALSFIAGSSDVISFLGLGGLFTAHVTGNLCLLAAHVVAGGTPRLAPMLSVPVFTAALALTRLLAERLEAVQRSTLRPLLAVEFVLLSGCFVLSVATGAQSHPGAPDTVVAGMLGVAAMAVQSALTQISLSGAPSTTVMTTSITYLVMDLGDILFHSDRQSVEARKRVRHAWPAILGFTGGCAVGAAGQVALGLWSLALPAALGLMALAMGMKIKPAPGLLGEEETPVPAEENQRLQNGHGVAPSGLRPLMRSSTRCPKKCPSRDLRR